MKCPNCQMNNNDTSNYCIHCGTQFNQMNQIPVSSNSTNSTEEKTGTKKIVFLVLSIINLYFIFPAVFMFGTLWSLFGGLSGNATQYYLTLILCVFYIIASFVCFLMSAWNLLKTNKTSKKVTLIITAIIALLGVGTFCYYQYFPDSARERASRVEEAEKGRSFPLKNDILYEDNDIIINIDKMYHYDNRIEIVFRLTNHSNIYYNFHINQVKANDLDILFSYKNPTKFSKVENWVDPDDYSDYYIMYISDYNLDNTIHGIRELRKLSFQLKIYSNSFDGTGVKENITDYYDIVLR